MSRISQYNLDATVEGSDKLLGSNADGSTRNFSVNDIQVFLSETNTSGTSSSFTFRYKQSNRGQGDMNFIFSSGSTFDNVTAIKVSKYNHKSQNVVNKALELLNGKKVIIYDINNRNNYGVFDAANITVDSNDSNFFILYSLFNKDMIFLTYLKDRVRIKKVTFLLFVQCKILETFHPN